MRQGGALLLVLILGMLLAAPPAAAADPAPAPVTPAPVDSTHSKAVTHPSVRVEVTGVEGPLRKNVLASLSIADKGKRKKATAAEIRNLHSRAEDEIRRALQPFGYYRPMIHAELVTDQQWVARYEIQQGPPLLVDSLLVQVIGEGASDPKYLALIRDFPLHKGSVLLHPSYEAGKAAFEAYSAEAGYLDAAFLESRMEVDLSRYTATVVVRYDTGPKHYFGDITFDRGIIDPDILARFPSFKQGDTFDFRKLLTLQTDLSTTGYFTKVEINRSDEVESVRQVPIQVDLAPSKKLRFTGGVGYGTDEGARVRETTEWRRLNAQGHHASIDLQYGLRDKHAVAQYFIPWPNPRSDVATFMTGYQDLNTVTSRSRVAQVGVSESRLLGKWRVLVALNDRRERFVVGDDSNTVNTLVPEGSWTRIRTGNVIYVTNGDRVRLDVRGAHVGALSDVSFVQGTLGGKWIKGFGSRLRGLARFDVGGMTTNDFHMLPPSQRFFAGGTNSVRGYSYNSLGPRDENDHVTGGTYLLTGSLELNQLILPKWGVAEFYDMGNALRQFGDPLKRGVGVGLRWASPAGMIRTDFGWGLDRAGTPLQIHFAMGSEL
jgi:translocation and assembly module TamA